MVLFYRRQRYGLDFRFQILDFRLMREDLDVGKMENISLKRGIIAGLKMLYLQVNQYAYENPPSYTLTVITLFL